jgi:hypothetical protein
VWPRWRSGYVIVIAKQSVVVCRPGGGTVRASDGPYADLDETLAALRALPVPRPAALYGRSVGVWIDDTFTRLFGTTWPEGIDDLATFRAYVAARFEQRFDLSADDWTIVSPGAWPGRPVLCVAAPRTLLEALRASLAVHGLRPGRVTPLSLVEVGASIPTRPRLPTLVVGSAGPTRSVFLLTGGRLADCAVLPDAPRIEVLAEAVFRERGLVPAGVRRVLSVALDRAAATDALIARRQLPLHLLQPDSPASPVPAGAAELAS